MYMKVEGGFKCNECGIIKKSTSVIRHHLIKTICGTGEGNPFDERQKWTTMYTEVEGGYRCNRCGTIKKFRSVIRQHLTKTTCGTGEENPDDERQKWTTMYTELEDGRFKCNQCGSIKKARSGVWHHLQISTCGTGKRTPTTGEKQSWMKLNMYTQVEDGYKCNNCSFISETQSGVYYHLNNKCGTEEGNPPVKKQKWFHMYTQAKRRFIYVLIP